MLTLRNVLTLSIGIVLGLGLAVSAAVWSTLGKDRHPRPAAQTASSESLELVAEVLDRVRREYVDRVDDRQLVEGAIRGIVKELDQHSSYLDPTQYEEIRISTSGNYTGVGLDVSVDDGKVTVVEPLAGAPAAEAGILPGDVVVSVDDVPVEQGNVAETVNRMRGAVGTPVTVDVIRGGANDKPLRFALTRASVQVKTVNAEYLGNGLAYFRLSAFAESTPHDLAVAAHHAIEQAGGKLLGVVLDLRNNPGGVLDAAVQVADEFLSDGLIVRGTGRVKQARFEQFASAGDELEGVPAVLLVNGASASASEIVAGALQDHQRAQIVGERTYGKGSVQTVMPLGEGSALKLTTSLYLTPSGRSINGRGIDPDVVVHNADPQRQYRGPGSPVAMADDQQLLEALRLISYASISLSSAR